MSDIHDPDHETFQCGYCGERFPAASHLCPRCGHPRFLPGVSEGERNLPAPKFRESNPFLHSLLMSCAGLLVVGAVLILGGLWLCQGWGM